MMKLALIFAGAGVGGVARYALAGWVQGSTDSPFPLGTLVVNLLGCTLVGFLNVALEATLVREEYRLAIIIGVLGGFTTFSTFSKETLALATDRQWTLVVANVLLTNALCLTGVWLGTRVGGRLYGV